MINIKKINIIRKNEDFNRIIKNNKPLKKSNFLIFMNKNTNFNYPRFGITISKKNTIAVIRNRIKRRVKAIIDQNDYKKNIDYIIIVNRRVINLEYLELKKQLEDALKDYIIK